LLNILQWDMTILKMLKNKYTWLAAILVSLMFTGALGHALYTKQAAIKKQAARDQFHGTLLHEPRPMQPFTLTGIDGSPFTQASLEKRWTMVFFGFTRCGFMCPTAMAELAKMYRMLDDEQVRPLPHVVMVSIDPKRDDLAQLKRYVTAFHPNFYGARGSEDMTRAMTRALGVAYAKIEANPNAPATEDDIEHTGAVMLFNPDGKLAAFFTTPHQARNLVEDYRWLIKNA
jgi:protein SCO1